VIEADLCVDAPISFWWDSRPAQSRDDICGWRQQPNRVNHGVS